MAHTRTSIPARVFRPIGLHRRSIRNISKTRSQEACFLGNPKLRFLRIGMGKPPETTVSQVQSVSKNNRKTFITDFTVVYSSYCWLIVTSKGTVWEIWPFKGAMRYTEGGRSGDPRYHMTVICTGKMNGIEHAYASTSRQVGRLGFFIQKNHQSPKRYRNGFLFQNLNAFQGQHRAA